MRFKKPKSAQKHFLHINKQKELCRMIIGNHISIIGSPGSGKSTLAKELSTSMQIPHIRISDIIDNYNTLTEKITWTIIYQIHLVRMNLGSQMVLDRKQLITDLKYQIRLSFLI